MKLCVVEHQMRSLLSFSSTVTYSPNTVTNKKPAIGGLENAQALGSLLMPSNCKVNDASNLFSSLAAEPRA